MKEQQSFNYEDFNELGKLEMTKEVVITLFGMGILSLFAFGFFFTALYTQFTGKLGFDYASGTIFLSVALFVGTMVLYELIHDVFMSKYEGKSSYGAGIAHYILPSCYATTKTVFTRNQFITLEEYL